MLGESNKTKNYLGLDIELLIRGFAVAAQFPEIARGNFLDTRRRLRIYAHVA